MSASDRDVTALPLEGRDSLFRHVHIWFVSLLRNGPKWTFRHVKFTGGLK